MCLKHFLYCPLEFNRLVLVSCLYSRMVESVLFPTNPPWRCCHTNISLINLESRTLISVWPFCSRWRYGPNHGSNYASCVMCCISQEGALLSEFPPRLLHLEHVKLSAQRSRWPICPALPMVFSRTPLYLAPPATTFLPRSHFLPPSWAPMSQLLLVSLHYYDK